MHPTQISIIKNHILAHGARLNDAVNLLRTAPNHWRTRLLILFATESLIQCRELLEGIEAENLCRIAWASRSMLELHYFVRFITEVPENAERFREDMVCDYQDLISACAKHPEHVAVTNAMQQILDHLWDKHLK